MILSRLALGSAATFMSIILWSKTRDTAWMLVIIGVIVAYGENVFQTLKAFGIVKAELLIMADISIFEIVLANLPMLFFAIAFLVMIIRRTLR
jgi:peroxiredoxin family protein